MINLAVANASSVVADDELYAMLTDGVVPQLTTFAKRWRCQAMTVEPPSFWYDPAALPADRWALLVTDDADQAGILGFHETSTLHRPVAKVFARTAQLAGVSVSSVLSHELCEVAADPWADRLAQRSASRFYAYEVCDPVEQTTYDVGGVEVSDYVFPRWFDPGSDGPWDVMGAAPGPLKLEPGGSYIGVYVCGQGWTQVYADGHEEPLTELRAVPGRHRLAQRRMGGLW